MDEDIRIVDSATLHESISVYDKFELEPLLLDLASESLEKAKKAEQEARKRVEIEKQHLQLQVAKYCAATIVFAHALVEPYLNWILQHRMLTHHDLVRKGLGEIIDRIRSPVPERWISIIEATGFLAKGKWTPVSHELGGEARELAELRNFIAHYKAKLVLTDKLPKRDDGTPITEAEQKLSLENAERAAETTRRLIVELHRLENSSSPKWL
jgi:hypothetical protein